MMIRRCSIAEPLASAAARRRSSAMRIASSISSAVRVLGRAGVSGAGVWRVTGGTGGAFSASGSVLPGPGWEPVCLVVLTGLDG